MFYFCTKQFFMKVSDIVANTINRLPKDYIYSYTDFNISVYSKEAVLKALYRVIAASKEGNPDSSYLVAVKIV